MMIYKPFSVVVVPFPFTDFAHTKKRPALVISSEEFQKKNKHVGLLMITSAKHSRWVGDHVILELEKAGLTANSIVRQKLFTLDLGLVLHDIGELSLQDKQAVMQLTRQHLKAIM